MLQHRHRQQSQRADGGPVQSVQLLSEPFHRRLQIISQRQSLVASAQQLATQFNQVSSQLAQLSTIRLNPSIQTMSPARNQDLTQIATLNQQIVLAQATAATANDLVDQREQAIEDLASKVNFTTTAQSNGAVNVSIGGVTMVSGGNATDSLQTYRCRQRPIAGPGAKRRHAFHLTGGSIEGNITARDGALARCKPASTRSPRNSSPRSTAFIPPATI